MLLNIPRPALIFDMDGVIIDSNPYHHTSLKEFCRSKGHELSEAEMRTKIYGRTNKDWITNLFGELPPEQLQAYADEKEALFREQFKAAIAPVPGLLEFLEWIERNNLPRAIATSAPRANVDFVFEHIPIEKYFDVVLDSSFVERGKPDPEIYLKAMDALGVTAAESIVLEDSLAGVAAGKAAGAKVIGLSTTHTAAELSETDLVVGDFRELSGLIN